MSHSHAQDFADELVYETTFGCDVKEDQAKVDAAAFVGRVWAAAQAALKQRDEATEAYYSLLEGVEHMSAGLATAEAELAALSEALQVERAARIAAERRAKSTGDRITAIKDLLDITAPAPD